MLKLIGLGLLLVAFFWCIVIAGDSKPLSRPVILTVRGLFTVSLLCLFYGAWYDC